MKFLFILLIFSTSFPLWARGTYQEPTEFLAETFQNNVPKASVIWLSGEVRKDVSEILTHKPNGLRVRYWVKDKKSAWILEEIGKTEPITIGFVINNNEIIQTKVLIFRESRGSEIRHDFFTRQFSNAKLTTENKLDRTIDGITGATLSVRALTRLSRVALYLNNQRLTKNDTP